MIGVDVREALLSRIDQCRRRDGKKEEWDSVTAGERATVYLCNSAGPQEMHDDRKDIYGRLRSGICLCAWGMGSRTIYSTIWPTCCYCTESSAEDKLEFNWDKLFCKPPRSELPAQRLWLWRLEENWRLFYWSWPRNCRGNTTCVDFVV